MYTRKFLLAFLFFLFLGSVFGVNLSQEIGLKVDFIDNSSLEENQSLILIEDNNFVEDILVAINFLDEDKLIDRKKQEFNGTQEELLEKIEEDDISKVYVNYEYKTDLLESQDLVEFDEFLDSDLGFTGEGVKVAILDSGAGDLADFEEDFSESGNSQDNFGHGKFVEKIVKSYAPNSEVYSLKVLGDNGAGSGSSLYSGILRAIELDVDIIQMSLGIPMKVEEDPFIQPLIERAIEEGIIVVVSAGNCGAGHCSDFYEVTFPARIEDVVAVGSINKQGLKSDFSSVGVGEDENFVKPDIVMVGENLEVLGSNLRGTSFATPQITGILALKIEEIGSNFDVFELLEGNSLGLGSEGKDSEYGFGLLLVDELFGLVDESEEEAGFSQINFSESNNKKNYKITNLAQKNLNQVLNFYDFKTFEIQNIQNYTFYKIETQNIDNNLTEHKLFYLNNDIELKLNVKEYQDIKQFRDNVKDLINKNYDIYDIDGIFNFFYFENSYYYFSNNKIFEFEFNKNPSDLSILILYSLKYDNRVENSLEDTKDNLNDIFEFYISKRIYDNHNLTNNLTYISQFGGDDISEADEFDLPWNEYDSETNTGIDGFESALGENNYYRVVLPSDYSGEVNFKVFGISLGTNVDLDVYNFDETLIGSSSNSNNNGELVSINRNLGDDLIYYINIKEIDADISSSWNIIVYGDNMAEVCPTGSLGLCSTEHEVQRVGDDIYECSDIHDLSNFQLLCWEKEASKGDFDFCSLGIACNKGEGDCDNDGQCGTGLYCRGTFLNDDICCEEDEHNSNGQCVDNCVSEDKYFCYNNDIYYYDSCGNREDKKTECNSDGCNLGSTQCNECSEGDNSCGSGEICSAGSCVAIDNQCIQNSDCSFGKECKQNACVDIICASYSNEDSSTLDSCDNVGNYERISDDVFKCFNLNVISPNLQCLIESSDMGDGDFCEEVVLSGSLCQEGEDECQMTSECAQGLVCDDAEETCSRPVIVNCYKDEDGDGFGNPTNVYSQVLSCGEVDNINYVSNNDDCNDNLFEQNPNSDWYLDYDEDGYVYDLDSPTTFGKCDRPDKHKLLIEVNQDDEDCYDLEHSLDNICIEGSVCNGRVQVIVEDNIKNGLNNIFISKNGENLGLTDSFGVYNHKIDNVGCFEDMEFEAKCSNGITSCDVKTAYLENEDDFTSVSFDCSVCSQEKDLSFDMKSLRVTQSSINQSNYDIRFNISNINVNQNQVQVRIYKQDIYGKRNDVFLHREFDVISNINNEIFFENTYLELTEFLHIYIDEKNEIIEEDEENNYLLYKLQDVTLPKVYLNLDLSSNLNETQDLIRNYLSGNFDLIDNKENADLIIHIGDTALIEEFGFDKYMEFRDGLDMPYTAKVFTIPYAKTPAGVFPQIYTPQVVIVGESHYGTIAGLKRFINAKNAFLSEENYQVRDSRTVTSPNAYYYYLESPKSIVDKYDLMGVGVVDKLDKIRKNSQIGDSLFNKMVAEILYDNNKEISVKRVRTLNTTSYEKSTELRIKHINSDFSKAYKDAFGIEQMPVVMSGGLWNNLDYWTSEPSGVPVLDDDYPLALRLTEKGYDVWTIELTGGPNQDVREHFYTREEVPNYNYEDLVHYYYPTLVGSVLEYSEQDKIQYIGFSNGCRVALSSINEYQENGKNEVGEYFDYETGLWKPISPIKPNFVDTFIGAGCPGAFKGYSWYKDYLGYFSERIENSTENYTHVTKLSLLTGLSYPQCNEFQDEDRRNQCYSVVYKLDSLYPMTSVSRNLLLDYMDFIVNENDTQPVDEGLHIRNAKFYTTELDWKIDWFGFVKNPYITFNKPEDYIQDGAVGNLDIQEIAQLINSTNNNKLLKVSNFIHGYNSKNQFRNDVYEVLEE